MQINAINIDKESQLIADYRENKQEIMQFFDYHPYQAFQDRINDLNKRNFQRVELADVLEKMNRTWGANAQTLQHIEQLKEPNSVVVIGGQQAGLLTGPLYTINKVISIIQLAREQQEKLNIPVIPVFWIAGEDHDYDEINHVYMPEVLDLKKNKLKQSLYKKSSVSHVDLEQETCRSWIEELFSTMKETVHTKKLYHMIMDSLERASSFTDFFAHIIFELFQEEGIVLIDSAHPDVRKLESDYFVQLIENQRKISHGTYRASEQLKEKGYSLSLEAEETDGHLFYHKDNERILLQRMDNGDWQGKQDEIQLTTGMLLETARNNPERLSNNVVTRPLIQELLFPTLAFIGGPGEIAYWAALKPAFHALDMKMPPVLPRLSYTYVPRNVKKALDFTGISIENAVINGSVKERTSWIENKQDPSIDEIAEELKQTIEEAHTPIREVAADIRSDVSQLSEKNLIYLHEQVDFLRNRMKKAVEEKYEKELYQYDLIEMVLHPEGGFQERKWNPLPFLNKYGFEFLSKVTNYPCSFKEKHYIVYL